MRRLLAVAVLGLAALCAAEARADHFLAGAQARIEATLAERRFRMELESALDGLGLRKTVARSKAYVDRVYSWTGTDETTRARLEVRFRAYDASPVIQTAVDFGTWHISEPKERLNTFARQTPEQFLAHIGEIRQLHAWLRAKFPRP